MPDAHVGYGLPIGGVSFGGLRALSLSKRLATGNAATAPKTEGYISRMLKSVSWESKRNVAA